MARLATFVFAVVVCAVLGLGPANAAKRSALVIGINDYDEVTDLEKAVGDARAMAGKLRQLGFHVTELVNADRRMLNQTISRFSASLSAGDTAFVHFSGHGVEIDGDNYLLPADVPKPASGQKNFIKSEAISMSNLVGRIAEGGARTRVFVIDACRDNPFQQAGVRAVGNTRGLARVEAPAGTFIMYSAGYRQLALDRLGKDDPEETSVYTRALLKHLGKPGKAIDDVAQDVRGEVERMARTVGHSQRPAYYDELSARLILVAPNGGDQDVAAVPDPSPTLGEAAQVWAATQSTTSVAVLEAFIKRFDATVYGDLAKARLEELKGGEDATEIASISAGETADQANTSGEQLAQEGEQLWRDGKHDEAFKLASQSAEMGDAQGMSLLGLLYDRGAGVSEDDGEAVRWMRKAAEAGHAQAMNNLAAMYLNGKGVAKDDRQAAKWYRKAAEGGLAPGMTNLGYLYEIGRGVTKDEHEAVKWYRKSAEAGNVMAMTNLGLMYANGRGIAKDEHGAVGWFRKSAEKGHVQAMANLAYLYEEGRGTTKDEYAAASWYRKAAERGNAIAMGNLGFMYETGRGVAKDEREAVSWYRKSADAGHALGMKNLAAMYQFGRGVTRDDYEAVKWYRKAAEAGNAAGMTGLGYMHGAGLGVSKDEREAVKWYRKAAEVGDVVAMKNLGVMYQEGLGVAKDEREAVRWYRQASDKGSTGAMHNLARLYNTGRGVARDERQAAGYILRALTGGDTFSKKEMTTNASAWSIGFRRELQRLMKEKGVYSGPIDGKFGPGTRRAIEALASG